MNRYTPEYVKAELEDWRDVFEARGETDLQHSLEIILNEDLPFEQRDDAFGDLIVYSRHDEDVYVATDYLYGDWKYHVRKSDERIDA